MKMHLHVLARKIEDTTENIGFHTKLNIDILLYQYYRINYMFS